MEWGRRRVTLLARQLATIAQHRVGTELKRSLLACAKNILNTGICSQRYKILLRTPCSTNSKCQIQRLLLLFIVDDYPTEPGSDPGNSLESPATRRAKGSATLQKPHRRRGTFKDQSGNYKHWRWWRRRDFANHSVSSCCRRATFD